MKNILCLLVLVFCLAKTVAQFHVVFKLNKFPSTHSSDSIFVAGNFNNWNPGNKGYVFSLTGNNTTEAPLQLAAGNYEFKCTRGSWRNVETQSDGKDIANRSFTLQSDTVIELSIDAWKDDFASAERKHTASSNVRVMDTAFLMPQLNRFRKIWIYLPEDYAKNKKHYPVLYMQDGQNLFDEYTSPFGEWGVDECLDSLIAKGKPACIVVGIENGPQRINEYSPYDTDRFGKGEGDAYLDFLAGTLKPYIDKNYRTLSSKENTVIAGSSVGALISYYAMLKRPDVFGKAGIFSPSFWLASPIKPLTDSLAGKISGKFFFYMGGKEGDSFIQDSKDIQESLGEKSSSMIYSVLDANGSHNEQAWRKWFAEFYGFIMADGFNNVVKMKE